MPPRPADDSQPVSSVTTPESLPESRDANDAEELIVHRDDGASVFVDVHGPRHAPCILILDGIGCSGWAFRRIVPVLAQRYRVALMHYRGHGRSASPPRPWSIGMHDLADDAAAVLDELDARDAIVVGFSMGFQVAVELYKRHRERVAGLVSLAGPSGRALAQFQGTGIFEHLLPLLRATTRHAGDLTSRLWKRLLPSKWLTFIGLHTQLNAIRIDLGDLQFYLNQMAEMSPELFVEMLHEAARHTTHDVLPQVRVPTLVIAGAQDRFVPMDAIRTVAFSIPDATWVVIHGASHALPAEFPEEIAAHLQSFANRVYGSL